MDACPCFNAHQVQFVSPDGLPVSHVSGHDLSMMTMTNWKNAPSNDSSDVECKT